MTMVGFSSFFLFECCFFVILIFRAFCQCFKKYGALLRSVFSNTFLCLATKWNHLGKFGSGIGASLTSLGFFECSHFKEDWEKKLREDTKWSKLCDVTNKKECVINFFLLYFQKLSINKHKKKPQRYVSSRECKTTATIRISCLFLSWLITTNFSQRFVCGVCEIKYE